MATSSRYLLAVVLAACNPEPPAMPRPTPMETPRSQEINDLFRSYARKLPEPANLSEGNGVSTTCDHHGGATYTLLQAAAERVPIGSDADLATLVKWTRDSDLCIREIALDAVVPRIGYPRDQLVIPSMHDPEHYLFHDILATLKDYLDRHHVTYDPKGFDGLMLAPDAAAFHARFDGTWPETDVENKGFHGLIELHGDELRVTSKHVPDDPKWPDSTQTTKIANVTVDAGQYVVTGTWSMESNAAGYQGPKNVPAQFVYRFWQVGERVMWFKDGNSPYWNKYRR